MLDGGGEPPRDGCPTEEANHWPLNGGAGRVSRGVDEPRGCSREGQLLNGGAGRASRGIEKLRVGAARAGPSTKEREGRREASRSHGDEVTRAARE